MPSTGCSTFPETNRLGGSKAYRKKTAIEMLKANTVGMVIAQKPGDMGFLAVLMAHAYLNGVTSTPRHIPTGYAIITRDNMDDPDISRFFYTK